MDDTVGWLTPHGRKPYRHHRKSGKSGKIRETVGEIREMPIAAHYVTMGGDCMGAGMGGAAMGGNVAMVHLCQSSGIPHGAWAMKNARHDYRAFKLAERWISYLTATMRTIASGRFTRNAHKSPRLLIGSLRRKTLSRLSKVKRGFCFSSSPESPT
jgi:hypothetical protein